jgi:hypothetical protein
MSGKMGELNIVEWQAGEVVIFDLKGDITFRKGKAVLHLLPV